MAKISLGMQKLLICVLHKKYENIVPHPPLEIQRRMVTPKVYPMR